MTEKSKSLYIKDVLPQIDEMKDAINSISTGFITGVLASLTGFSLAIITGKSLPLIPSLILGVSSGLNNSLQGLSKYQTIKNKPAFIWHKIRSDDKKYFK